MEKKYKIQKNPFVVPTTDGKLIQEHWGNSTGNSEISIAHMIAPPHWSEPHQTPEFDEFTIVISGKKQFEIDGEIVNTLELQSADGNVGAFFMEFWAWCRPVPCESPWQSPPRTPSDRAR